MAIGAGIYEPASPVEIRDGTVARLEAIAALKKVFKSRQLPTKDDQLPFAALWFGHDRTEPIGDANVGDPRLFHHLTLAIDVVVKGASEATVDADIIGLVETIKATLLTDSTWLELFEAVETVDTSYEYPKEAGTLFVQATIEIEVTFRSVWPPYVPNQFSQVQVSVKRPGAATETASIPQVINIETCT